MIAIFYTSDLSIGWLAASAAGVAALLLARRGGIRSMVFYVPVGLFVWFAMLESGVHATIAGVALGLLTPARPLYSSEEFDARARQILEISPAFAQGNLGRALVDHEALLLADVARESVSPLNRLEHALVPWSSFVVVPIFALANAGVNFAGIDMSEALTHPVTLGVFFGLVLGKLIGVTGFAGIAVALRLGKLPNGTSWNHVFGLAALAGIGFTVSLFITELAFTDRELADFSKIGIFAASIIAGVIGFLILRLGVRKKSRPRREQVDQPAPTP